jgi:hypothetical protein
VSSEERIWMTEGKHLRAPRKAVLNLHGVAGESCWYTKKRGRQKTRERSKGTPSVVTNLENARFGHFCWLEWQLMKIKCQQNKKVVLNYWESVFSHDYMRNRLYYLCTS